MRIFLMSMAVALALTAANTVRAAVTLLGANFYDASTACETGAMIKESDPALTQEADGTFVFVMNDRLEAVIFLAIEVTRENKPTKVVVEWRVPKNCWCRKSDQKLGVKKNPVTDEGKVVEASWNTRACRTLYVVPERDADCLGTWEVTLRGVDGKTLLDDRGNEAVYKIRVE